MVSNNRFDKNKVIDDINLLVAESGLPDVKPDSSIEGIIKTCSDGKLLANLDPIRLAEYAVLLSNYSFYLARMQNQLQTYIHWYESNINHMVGKHYDSFEGYGWIERSSKIKANEPAVAAFDASRQEHQVKLDYIKDLSFSLRLIIDNLQNLARIKDKHRKEFS